NRPRLFPRQRPGLSGCGAVPRGGGTRCRVAFPAAGLLPLERRRAGRADGRGPRLASASCRSVAGALVILSGHWMIGSSVILSGAKNLALVFPSPDDPIDVSVKRDRLEQLTLTAAPEGIFQPVSGAHGGGAHVAAGVEGEDADVAGPVRRVCLRHALEELETRVLGRRASRHVGH